MAAALTADAFAACKGTEFAVAAAGGAALPLTLIQVSRFVAPPHSPRPDPFSIEFVGPPQPVLPQAIYVFEHPAIGRFEVFIVPLGPSGPADSRMRYEAVFN
jgi:hypothetical protein